MQKKKYLIEKKEIKRIFWMFVLISSLLLLYLNLKNFNENTYCLAKVNNNWFYGKRENSIDFFIKSSDVKKIYIVFSNVSLPNYEPNFEELLEYNNQDILICQYGNWKNES
jgi:hypothetical protein